MSVIVDIALRVYLDHTAAGGDQHQVALGVLAGTISNPDATIDDVRETLAALGDLRRVQ